MAKPLRAVLLDQPRSYHSKRACSSTFRSRLKHFCINHVEKAVKGWHCSRLLRCQELSCECCSQKDAPATKISKKYCRANGYQYRPSEIKDVILQCGTAAGP